MLISLFHCLCVCIDISNAAGPARDAQGLRVLRHTSECGMVCRASPCSDVAPATEIKGSKLLSRSRNVTVFNRMCGPFRRQKIIMQLSR